MLLLEGHATMRAALSTPPAPRHVEAPPAVKPQMKARKSSDIKFCGFAVRWLVGSFSWPYRASPHWPKSGFVDYRL